MWLTGLEKVYEELDKDTIFVDGLRPSFHTTVARYQEKVPGSMLTVDDMVQFAVDGDAYCALDNNSTGVRHSALCPT